MFEKISLDGIKYILMDLDDTLYEYHPCHKYALKACYEELSRIEDIEYKVFNDYYQKSRRKVNVDLLGQGASHSRFLYFQKFFEDFYGKTCIDLTIRFEKLYWDTFFEKMKLRKGVIQFLDYCIKKDINIAIITDLTAKLQFEKLKKLNIEKYFKFIVSSEEAGCEKPHSYIFKLALEKLNANTKETLVVGDSLSKDIEGAQNLNLKVFHIKDLDKE